MMEPLGISAQQCAQRLSQVMAVFKTKQPADISNFDQVFSVQALAAAWLLTVVDGFVGMK